MNRNRNINLQLFANPNTQTTLLNGSGNDLSPEMKIFYSDYLIDLAEPELVHDQFGDEYDIPQNGGKTIEFRKFSSLPKALTPLTEGVTPDGNKLNVSTITATIKQYGDYITVSDILKLTAIDNVIVQALQALGSSAGRTLDTITRDVLAGGTSVIYSGGKKSRSALTAADTLTPDDIFRAATFLKGKNAPKKGDGYVAIIHPYTAYDLMKHPDWVSAAQYEGSQKIFNGEIGKIRNVRFVESTEAKIWNASADNTPSGLAVYSTLVMGAKAYGKTKVRGGGLETIVKQLGSGEDPLNQRSTVGWKATKTAERLVEEYMVRIESTCTFSPNEAAN